MSYIGANYTQQLTTPAIDYFSGNGVTTTFTLTRSVTSVFSVEVVVNGVQQNPRTAYTINQAGNLVFDGAPSVGTNNIYVMYNSQVGQFVTPSPGTVPPSSLTPNGPNWDVNGNTIISGNATINGTESLKLPTGTSLQRPASPADGMVRKNSTTGYVEYFDPLGNTWRTVLNRPQFYSFSGSITFTPCGATGRMGPTLAQARSTYTGQPFQSSWLNNLDLFWVEQGVQYWRVPRDGTYTIDLTGAGNSLTFSGLGARISAQFALFAGEVLRIVVGQTGVIYSSAPTTNVGGAGASAVSVFRNDTHQLLAIAGGGAGRSNNTIASAQDVRNATYTNTGIPEGGFGSVWQLAYATNSGLVNYWPGGGGGGWARKGATGGIGDSTAKKENGGDALSASAIGGFSEPGIHGGFGGGGGVGRDGGAGGGGGGYNGGHAEAWNGNQANDYATGGGSYVGLGATQTNISRTNTGNGQVIITL